MRPAINSRRRLIRSPKRPKSSSKPLKPSVYALSTHCDPLAVKFMARLIAGSACHDGASQVRKPTVYRQIAGDAVEFRRSVG